MKLTTTAAGVSVSKTVTKRQKQSGMEAQSSQKNSQTRWITEPKGHHHEVNVSIQPCPHSQPTKPMAQEKSIRYLLFPDWSQS